MYRIEIQERGSLHTHMLIWMTPAVEGSDRITQLKNMILEKHPDLDATNIAQMLNWTERNVWCLNDYEHIMLKTFFVCSGHLY